jgi:hypothetical protein
VVMILFMVTIPPFPYSGRLATLFQGLYKSPFTIDCVDNFFYYYFYPSVCHT